MKVAILIHGDRFRRAGADDRFGLVAQIDADTAMSAGKLAAGAGDAAAQAILEQVYDYMGQFLADVCCILDPDVVVIGGGLTGCEIAYELYLQGKNPTIVEMLDLLSGMPGRVSFSL